MATVEVKKADLEQQQQHLAQTQAENQQLKLDMQVMQQLTQQLTQEAQTLRNAQYGNEKETCYPYARPDTLICSIYIGHTKTRIPGVIDTGADCCVIRNDVFQKLPSQAILSRSKPGLMPYLGATGDSLFTLCIATIMINLEGHISPQEFLVVKNLQKPLILGSDYIAKWRGNIDFDRRRLILDKKHVVPLYRSRHQKAYHLPEVQRQTSFTPSSTTEDKEPDIVATDNNQRPVCSIATSNRFKVLENEQYFQASLSLSSEGDEDEGKSEQEEEPDWLKEKYMRDGRRRDGRRPESDKEAADLDEQWHDSHRLLELLRAGYPLNRAQRAQINETVKLRPARIECDLENEDEAEREEEQGWPDSMPLWLKEKYTRDGRGPEYNKEAADPEEQWNDRHTTAQQKHKSPSTLKRDRERIEHYTQGILRSQGSENRTEGKGENGVGDDE